jgi:hypothetical protein
MATKRKSRYIVHITCDTEGRTTLFSFDVDASTPSDALRIAEQRLRAHSFECQRIIGVSVQVLDYGEKTVPALLAFKRKYPVYAQARR